MDSNYVSRLRLWRSTEVVTAFTGFYPLEIQTCAKMAILDCRTPLRHRPLHFPGLLTQTTLMSHPPCDGTFLARISLDDQLDPSQSPQQTVCLTHSIPRLRHLQTLNQKYTSHLYSITNAQPMSTTTMPTTHNHDPHPPAPCRQPSRKHTQTPMLL